MDIKPVYLFYGEETYLIGRDLAIFLRHFTDADGVSTAVRLDGAKTSLSTVLDSAEEVPLFGAERLVIVENTPWFTAGAEDLAPLFTYLDAPNENTCLVFVAEKVDKRLKTVKKIEQIGKVRRYDKLKPWQLPDYVVRYLSRQGKRITPIAVELLLQLTGEELGIISSELDKLLLTVGEDAYIDEEAVKRVIADTAAATMFHLSDAINRRDVAAVNHITAKLLTETPAAEYPVLQGYVANHLRLLIQCQELAANNEREKAIAKRLGVHEYRVKKALVSLNRYTIRDLTDGLRDLLSMDYKVKSGRASFSELFPLTLLRLCRASQKRCQGL